MKKKSIHLAGELLELTGRCSGEGHVFAERLLTSGKALEKFETIREKQGRRDNLLLGSCVKEIFAYKSGRITNISNRVIGRISQLAGAPSNPGAGVHLSRHVNDFVNTGDSLFMIYADSDEALNYALRHWEEKRDFGVIIA